MLAGVGIVTDSHLLPVLVAAYALISRGLGTDRGHRAVGPGRRAVSQPQAGHLG